MKQAGQHGYAMAALLVALSVMAVMLTAAMPVWHQAVQREREAELIFRGEQYVRALRLFQAKAGPGVLPPSLDLLVEQRFLRKKFVDPVTGRDFRLLSPVQPPAAGEASVGRGGITGVASTSTATSIRQYNGRTRYDEWQFVFTAQTQAPGVGGGPAGGPPSPGRSGQPPGPGASGGAGGGRGRSGQPPSGRGTTPPGGG